MNIFLASMQTMAHDGNTMSMKMMTAKYNGNCRACGKSIRKGDAIAFAKGDGAYHEDCAAEDNLDLETDEDDAAGLERGTLASDRRLARNGLTVVRFSSGESYTQNSHGRCEDAPCCGCCS